MSRCVPIQTNVNTDSTFFLPAGAPVPPPPPPGTGYSTITAADFISTNNLVVSSINNFTPAIQNGLSSVTAANSITSSNAFVSSVNNAAYIPVTNYVVSTLFVSSFGLLTTPQITISSINVPGQQYPPVQNPNLVVSTLTAATTISTVLAEINQVNNAPFISTLSTLTIPPDLVVSTFTASTITVPQLSLDTMSTGSIVFTQINTPILTTSTILGKPIYQPGYIIGTGNSFSTGPSTIIDILANYGPVIMSTLLPNYTVFVNFPGNTNPAFPGNICSVIPQGISTFLISLPASAPANFIFRGMIVGSPRLA